MTVIVAQEETSRKPKYRVEVVEKTTPPTGMSGDNWHRYVIGTGPSKIEGKKPGTLRAVTEHAESVAVHLNERTGARSYSAYTSRKTK